MNLKEINWQKLSWILAVEAALIFFLMTFFLPGGDDLFRYYRPFAAGCLDCGFVPYFVRWLLAPLAWIPRTLVWPIFTGICLAVFLLLCQYTRVNPALFMLSFPLLGQVWLGQIDMLVSIGLVIVLYSNKHFLRGAGLVLLATKPQVSGFILLLILLNENRKDILKLLTVPLVVLTVSLIQFGWDWPAHWLTNAVSGLPTHVWRLAAGDLWPFALILLPIPFFFKGKDRIKAGLLVSSMAVPVFGVYSYVVFLLLGLPIWAITLSYVWVAALPFLGNEAIRFSWLLPAALLGHMVYLRFSSRVEKQQP